MKRAAPDGVGCEQRPRGTRDRARPSAHLPAARDWLPARGWGQHHRT